MVKSNLWPLFLIIVSIVLCILLILNGRDINRTISDLAYQSIDLQADRYRQELRRCSGGGRMNVETVKKCLQRLLEGEGSILQFVVLKDGSGREVARFDEGRVDEMVVVRTIDVHRGRLPGYSVELGFHQTSLRPWMDLGKRSAIISLFLGIALLLFGAMAVYAMIRNVRLHEAVLKSSHLKEIGTMSAQLSHEIRNPLSSIRGLAQILREEITEPDLKEHLAVIIGETSRLDVLTRDLLTFARPPKPKPRRVNVHDEVRKILHVCDPGGMVELVPGGEESEVDVDPDHFRQILGNLIRNALEAVEEGDQITLAVEERDRALFVKVVNPARHLCVEDLETMFTMFHTTKSGGSGLGLTIARNLAEAAGGKLTAELKTPDAIRMTLELPRG